MRIVKTKIYKLVIIIINNALSLEDRGPSQTYINQIIEITNCAGVYKIEMCVCV